MSRAPTQMKPKAKPAPLPVQPKAPKLTAVPKELQADAPKEFFRTSEFFKPSRRYF